MRKTSGAEIVCPDWRSGLRMGDLGLTCRLTTNFLKEGGCRVGRSQGDVELD